MTGEPLQGLIFCLHCLLISRSSLLIESLLLVQPLLHRAKLELVAFTRSAAETLSAPKRRSSRQRGEPKRKSSSSSSKARLLKLKPLDRFHDGRRWLHSLSGATASYVQPPVDWLMGHTNQTINLGLRLFNYSLGWLLPLRDCAVGWTTHAVGYAVGYAVQLWSMALPQWKKGMDTTTAMVVQEHRSSSDLLKRDSDVLATEEVAGNLIYLRRIDTAQKAANGATLTVLFAYSSAPNSTINPFDLIYQAHPAYNGINKPPSDPQRQNKGKKGDKWPYSKKPARDGDHNDRDGSGKTRGTQKGNRLELRAGGRLFACHFTKLDPNKYRHCSGRFVLTKVSYVKQHLFRCHTIATNLWCANCWSVFDDQDEYETHTALLQTPHSCQTRLGPEDILPEEFANLSTMPRRQTEEQQWYWIWNQLFRGHPPPGSPFVENFAEEFNHYREPFMTVLERAFQEQLQPETMQLPNNMAQDTLATLVDIVNHQPPSPLRRHPGQTNPPLNMPAQFPPPINFEHDEQGAMSEYFPAEDMQGFDLAMVPHPGHLYPGPGESLAGPSNPTMPQYDTLQFMDVTSAPVEHLSDDELYDYGLGAVIDDNDDMEGVVNSPTELFDEEYPASEIDADGAS